MVDGMRIPGWTLVVGLLAVSLAGCPKRDTGTIDVDAIQRRVDTIEGHMKGMRQAIANDDLDEAEDRYQEAAEEYSDNRNQLAAYPEISLLTEQLEEAAISLCYAFVDVNLKRFFHAVRAKEVDTASEQLEKSQEEFKRCRPKIESRDDFMALRMNLESAPRSLAALKKELARQQRLMRIKAVKQELAPRLEAIERKVAGLEANPNQRTLAREVDAAIKSLKADLDTNDFGEDPDWAAVAGRFHGVLGELDRRRAACVRRGKILWTVENLLPKASKKATMAVTTRDKKTRLEMVENAHQSFSQCEQLLGEALQQEPALAKFDFAWRGSKRTAAWLRKHCTVNRRITARMIARLSGKKPPPPAGGKPGAKKSSDETTRAGKTGDEDAAEQSTRKKKRRRRRRGRIRRW